MVVDWASFGLGFFIATFLPIIDIVAWHFLSKRKKETTTAVGCDQRE